MYTQCPHCDTAFRVTAPDLQRASGRVACVGCRRDFNALEKLTEGPPVAAGQEGDANSLLDTLNELTGPHEIRIEDTGVEWRVIDVDEETGDIDSFSDEYEVAVRTSTGSDDDIEGLHTPEVEVDTGLTSSVRWYLDEPAGPQALHEAAQELPAETADRPVDSHTGDGHPSGQYDLDVQRYDDNTPLPEDFPEEALDEPIPRRRAEDRIEARSPEADEAQVDLALGEPDDWVDLLDEVAQRNDAAASAEDGAVTPAHAASATAAAQEPGLQDRGPETGPPARQDALASAPAADLAEEDEAPEDDDFPSDIDTQFDLQAIEMGIDLTGSRDLSPEEELERDSQPRAAPHGQPAAIESGRPGPEESEEELATDNPPERRLAAAAAAGAGAAGADQDYIDVESDDGGYSLELVADESPPEEDPDAAEEQRRERAFEDELAAAWATADDEVLNRRNGDRSGRGDAARGAADADEAVADERSAKAEDGPGSPHYVPPQTEEEMTINMLIDQDLIRLAEQQEVFTSSRKLKRAEDAPHVETIIMEGDFVRNALETDLLSGRETGGVDARGLRDEAEPGAGKSRVPKSAVDDGDILESYLKSNDRVRGGRRRSDPPSYRVIAGVAALALVLAAQVVHAYRDTLATYPMFERSIGPVYRLLGKPLNPVWDIRKWQFEATSGRTGETDEALTISSRLANSSSKALPYPLLHVSLTDRWEEIIGSKVLEPAAYLPGDADPSARVPPGQGFTALVRVEAPSPEATGFKLNVCYPEIGNRVRCATEDFKD